MQFAAHWLWPLADPSSAEPVAVFCRVRLSGIKTPKPDLDLIDRRSKAATQDYMEWQAKQGV